MEKIEETFDSYAGQLARRVELALAEFAEMGEGCPRPLEEAMRYSLLAGGKRLRPMLVLLAAEACGAEEQAAIPAACAVEMIHTYSLIHDDLPAMDDDDLRRGRPTNHKVYGEAMAILAGDALLTLAFETLALHVQPPHIAAACCAALAQAAGARGMVGGQADDMLAEKGENGKQAEPLVVLKSIHARKTGALLRVSLQLGGLVAQASGEWQQALSEYGRCLGLAFQIVDDLLDVQGDEAAMGKRVGKDNSHGKLTFPGLMGTDASRHQAEQLIMEARGHLQPLGARATRLDALALYVLERNR